MGCVHAAPIENMYRPLCRGDELPLLVGMVEGANLRNNQFSFVLVARELRVLRGYVWKNTQVIAIRFPIKCTP